MVNLDDILTVPIAILEDRVTTLGRERILQVNAAIAFALDLT
jgi:mRNA-degrading endonuclease toxin of MazEF toxin-antitoxin module